MKKRRVGVLGEGRYFDNPQLAMDMAAFLIKANQEVERKLSPEELLKRKEERKRLQEERHIKACITSGKCPECTSKLIRGKKDRNNDYKRTWDCGMCGNTYLM